MTQPMQPLVNADPVATPQQVADMQETIRQVRTTIARFHDLRRKNNERAAGLRAAKLIPQQVQQVLTTNRKPRDEQVAVEQLRQFLRILRGQEPTPQDMRNGIPEGMEDQLGLIQIPAAIAISIASVGAGVVSVFTYLSDVEETNQRQTATPIELVLQALSDNIWAVAAAGAIGLGGYVYYKSKKSDEEEHRRQIEKIEAMGKAVGGEMRAELKSNPDDEDESFIDKAKGVVQNVLFPPEKNPGLTPGEQLIHKFEALTEEERERFKSILDGYFDDDDDDDDVETEEREGGEKKEAEEKSETSDDEEESSEETDEEEDEE